MDHLYFVVHTHWDREWYQPFQQMRARLVEMADRMLPMVEGGALPSFHFDGQTIVLEDYLEVRPDAARRIANLVRAGKVQIGPWYVLADSFLVSGESLIRNLELGLRVAHRFGPALDAGYLPDQFGHIAQLPQILAGFGFRTAVLWRGVGGDVARNRFIWEALDGSSVLTVYLPQGYSNGANFPLDTADAFLARARDIARRERSYADGVPILVMNGTDHAIPDSRLMERIAEAKDTADLSLEVGPLETYLKRLAELPAAGLTTHRSELRSPLRAHLLPSVTSARTWIKQRDFENCRTLERLADPLAALANALGRARGLDSFLDLAWKIELQNHPHDSICGCSVDQVHDDMRYRFDQAAIIAEGVVRRASGALLRSGASGAPAIAVFNPTFGESALVTGEVELPDPAARYVLRGPGDARVPIVTDQARAGRLFEVEMAAAEFKATVAGLSEPALMGRTVSRYSLREASAGRFELDLLMTRTPAAPADLREFKAAIATAIPDSARIVIRATEAARTAVSFVASGLAQAGFTFYRLVRDDSPAAASEAPDSSESIANEFFSVRANARGLEIRDLKRGAAFELHFEDDGDRGDEYNFDPVPGSAPISAPATLSARVIERGPVRQRLHAALQFDVPGALAPKRASRAPETEPLPVELTATLYAGLERIDFEAVVTNRSRDHRLRAALRTPIATNEAVHDTSFGIVRRPLRRVEPPGTEDIYPTVPHRTFTAVEGEQVSAALMSRGIYEVEVRPETAGSTILLTLLRAVGWLSRSDLAMRRGGAGPELETPGAQELGEHRFEFAMTSFGGGYAGDSGFIQLAAAYAYPPRAFAVRAAPAASDELQLGTCDNPRIVFSTARPGTRAGSYRLRAYSMSEQPERTRFSFGAARRARMIDLAGRLLRGRTMRRRRDGSLELELRPFEVVTFEVGVKKNFDRDRQKY